MLSQCSTSSLLAPCCACSPSQTVACCLDAQQQEHVSFKTCLTYDMRGQAKHGPHAQTHLLPQRPVACEAAGRLQNRCAGGCQGEALPHLPGAAGLQTPTLTPTVLGPTAILQCFCTQGCRISGGAAPGTAGRGHVREAQPQAPLTGPGLLVHPHAGHHGEPAVWVTQTSAWVDACWPARRRLASVACPKSYREGAVLLAEMGKAMVLGAASQHRCRSC